MSSSNIADEVKDTTKINIHEKSATEDLIKLENRMQIIENKMDRIIELLENDCKKMREHIDFVENVYENVKTPFNYVMNSITTIMYNDKPSITNIEK